MNILLPNDGKTICCPYPQYFPVMNQAIAGKIDGATPAQCMGKICGIYDSCQGDYSPKALAQKEDKRRVANYLAIASIFDASESFPMVGGIVKKLAEIFRTLALSNIEPPKEN